MSLRTSTVFSATFRGPKVQFTYRVTAFLAILLQLLPFHEPIERFHQSTPQGKK